MKLKNPIVGASLCLIAFVAGCSSGSSAAKDVTIAACTASPSGGRPTATGHITNHSSKASIYTVHVKFSDASGNGVGDGFAAVAKVDAGASASWKATGTLDAKGPLRCKLSSVTRNSVP